MNPITLMWIGSIGGAAIFFAAGMLARRKPVAVASAPSPGPDLSEVAALRESLHRAEQERDAARLAAALEADSADTRNVPAPPQVDVAALERRAAEAQAALQASHTEAQAALQASRAEAQAALQASRAEAEGLKRERRDLLERANAARTLKTDNNRLKREADGLRAELSRAQDTSNATEAQSSASTADLQDALRSLESEVKGSRQMAATLKEDLGHAQVESERQKSEYYKELEAVRAEKDQLRLGMEGLQSSAVDEGRFTAIDEERKELAVQLEITKRRLADFSRMKNENAVLQQQIGEADHLRAQVRELEQVVKALEAEGLARPETIAVPVPAPLTKSGGEDALQRLINGLAELDGMHAATLADHHGLPVAGIGDHTEDLAACSAYLTDVGDRAMQLLPLGSLQRVVVEGSNGATLTYCPITFEENTLSLATLTSGAGPRTAKMTEILRGAVGVLT